MEINSSPRWLLWFSRLLRWTVGLFFIGAGIQFYQKGAWPAILFGAVIFGTGFLRPRRCVEDRCRP